MFNNIGRKIKVLSKVLCWLGIIASILFGIVMIIGGSALNSTTAYSSYYDYKSEFELSGMSLVITGIVTMILGSFFSWIGSFCLYGFGQLVDNSDIRTRLAVERSLRKPENED